MAKVIEQGAIVDDSYTLLEDKEQLDISGIDAATTLLPLAVYQANKDKLPAEGLAIWLDSDEPAELIKDELAAFSLVAVNFPAFTDGRGYSYAYTLRDTYHYHGKLRAIGDVLIDQLSALKRVGFDSFALRDDQDLEEALSHFADFSHPYQASISPEKPLFRNL